MLKIKDFINEKDINKFSSDCFGFWDWFCKGTKLENIAKSMRYNLKFLVKKQIIDVDSTGVWFKNDFDLNNTMVFKDIKNDKNIGHIKITTNSWNGNKYNKITVVAYDDDIGGNNSYWDFENMNWKDFKDKINNDRTFTALLGRIFRPKEIYERDINISKS